MAKELTKDNFKDEIASGVTLVDFWAEWCGPCKMVAPVIEQLSNELQGDVKVAKLDTDAHPEVAQEFGIMSIPTLMLFKDGKVVDTLVGAYPKPAIVEFIEKNR